MSSDSSVSESVEYKKLFALVDDWLGFYNCNVEGLRLSDPAFEGKSDGEIRRSQLQVVTIPKSGDECALYARELRRSLPDGVQLSADGSAILKQYTQDGKVSKLVLSVLRAECYNAGLLFMGSHELWRLLELLHRTSIQRKLMESDAKDVVTKAIDVLSEYFILRSDFMSLIYDLYVLLKLMDDGESIRGLEWLVKLYSTNICMCGAHFSRNIEIGRAHV